ncbi:MAG: hypothetical protein CVU41_00505 [Chloroflexi bacterium HGW-Chloroflexi-3]|nr:MAG: hypothetical protein CVU41_00505 [Chloroflexi bacterium HGW-Chloroflexi-3]
MKTVIIQLDPFDNVISIREKIAWSKTQRILLVWPNKGKIKLDPMDIILILRSAESLGAHISVVTDEPVIVNRLKELGVSIFSSIPEAQKKPWRKPKIRNRSLLSGNSDRNWNQIKFDRKSQNPNKELSIHVRWIMFAVGLLSTILIIFIFIPSAQITLYPMLEEQAIQMNFRSDPSIKEINMTGAIPFRVIDIEMEGQLEGDSTGIIRIPDKKATGEVTFRNISDKEIIIPEGTIVRTGGDPLIRFETTKEAILKPGIESQIDVPILSLSGGTIGNVSVGSITSIENDLGGNIVVFNTDATYGGVDIKTFSPTENDYEKLKIELIELLKMNSIEEIRKTNPQVILIPEEAIKIDEIIAEERIPEVGDPAERHVLRIRANVSGWIFTEEDVKKSVELAMNADLNNQFYANEGDMRIDIIDNSVIFDESELQWEVKAKREISPCIDENFIIQSILGLKIETAKSIIKNEIKLSNDPVIVISPSFWKYLPFLPFRINMVIDG